MEKRNYIDLTKEIKQKYKELKQLLQEEGITEKVFTDKFLELAVEVSDRLSLLLGEKSETTKVRRNESLEKLYQRSISQAIDRIIEIQDTPEIELDYSLFKPGKKLNGNKNREENIEVKETQKYNEFLRVYYELYLGRDDVTKEVYIEKLDESKMRKVPYRIIYVKGANFGRTILISDQIGEASFAYDGIIDKGFFQNIEKGEEINGKKPNRIIYGSRYGERLKEQLKVKFKELEEVKKTDKQILEEENKALLRKFIIDLWRKGELGEDFIKTRKIKQYSKNWNYKNAETRGFTLPASIDGLVGILGGDRSIYGVSQKYIKSLLEGIEYKKIRLIAKKELQDLWQTGKLGEDYIKPNKIKIYGENWNNKNAEILGFKIPTGINHLINILGGNSKTYGTKQEYVKSLLEGKEYKKIRVIIKNELQKLWQNGEFGEDLLKVNKIKKYSENWNKKNALDYGFKLPKSIDGLIRILGGNISIYGAGQKYVKSLLEKNELKLVKITKKELQDLWQSGELSELFIKKRYIKKYSEDWNNKKSESFGFILPTSIGGIIGILGGDPKVYGYSEEYVRSLLEIKI